MLKTSWARANTKKGSRKDPPPSKESIEALGNISYALYGDGNDKDKEKETIGLKGGGQQKTVLGAANQKAETSKSTRLHSSNDNDAKTRPFQLDSSDSYPTQGEEGVSFSGEKSNDDFDYYTCFFRLWMFAVSGLIGTVVIMVMLGMVHTSKDSFVSKEQYALHQMLMLGCNVFLCVMLASMWSSVQRRDRKWVMICSLVALAVLAFLGITGKIQYQGYHGQQLRSNAAQATANGSGQQQAQAAASDENTQQGQGQGGQQGQESYWSNLAQRWSGNQSQSQNDQGQNYKYRDGTIYDQNTKTFYSYEDFTEDEWTNLYKNNKQYTYDEWMAYYEKNEKKEDENKNDGCSGNSNYRSSSNCNNGGRQGNYGGQQSVSNSGGYNGDDSYDDDAGPWTGFYQSKATSSSEGNNSSSVAAFLGVCALCLVAIGFLGAKFFPDATPPKEEIEMDFVSSNLTKKEQRKGVEDMSCETDSESSVGQKSTGEV